MRRARWAAQAWATFAVPRALRRKARGRSPSQASTLVMAAQWMTASGLAAAKAASNVSGRVMSASGRSATAHW